jgi:hypothetical protein
MKKAGHGQTGLGKPLVFMREDRSHAIPSSRTWFHLCRTWINECSRIFIVALLWFASSSQSIGQPFHAAGHLEYKVMEPSGKLEFTSFQAFQVNVSNCSWSIIIPGDKNTPLAFREFVFDGQTLFDRSKYDSSKLEPLRTDPRDKHANTNRILLNLDLLPDPFPLMDPSLATAAWIAYASRCYFGPIGTNGVARPALVMDESIYQERDYEVPIQVDYAGKTDGFPSRIAFVNRGTYLSRDKDGKLLKKNGRVAEFPYPKSLGNGFVEADYRVLEFQDVSGTQFPKHFTITYYAPTFNTNNSSSDIQVYPFATIDGIATNLITTNITVETILPINEQTYVKERRLYGQAAVIPYVTTNKLYATNDESLSKLSKSLERRKQREKVKKSTPHVDRVWVIFAIGTLALPGLIFLAVNIKRNKIKTNEKK